MNFNWYALAVAILANVVQEQAFELLETGTFNPLYGENHTADMIQMHQQGITLRAIGEMYGISESAVCKRIKYHQNKKNRPTAMVAAT